jgi:hypothetical protein
MRSRTSRISPRIGVGPSGFDRLLALSLAEEGGGANEAMREEIWGRVGSGRWDS